MDNQFQKSVRFAEPNNNSQPGPQYGPQVQQSIRPSVQNNQGQQQRNPLYGTQGQQRVAAPQINTASYAPARPVLQQVNLNQQSHSGSKVSSAIAELRNTYNAHVTKLSASRLSEQTIPINEISQTNYSMVSQQPSCCASNQNFCSCHNNHHNTCQQQMQPIVVAASSSHQKKKKNKKRVSQIEEMANVQTTPKRETKVVRMRDPEIDNVKNEIHELERIIRNIEIQPQQQQKEIEIQIKGEDKKCMKKLCKKIKSLEKELYDVARQRDESLIIKIQLEKENTEMFDRLGELEALLKAADRKIFDLSIISERQGAYVRSLEDEVQRLKKKKKKRSGPTQIKEIIVEKYIDRPQSQPQEIIRNVPVDRIIERPIEVIREVIVEKIVEVMVEIPKIQYIDRPVIQYIEKIIEVPVERRVEIPITYEKIVQVPVERIIYQDRIVEVPVERVVIKEIPVERVVERIVEKIREIPVKIIQEVPVDVIREVPFDRYVEIPYEKIVEVPVIQYIDRPVYIDVPYEKIVEVPIERRVEVPYDRVVNVPYDRVVEVPVDRVIETRDDREIYRLQNDNSELLSELRSVREKLVREIEVQRRDGNQESFYLRDQLRIQDGSVRDLSGQLEQQHNRCDGLESALSREREIVSDLQQRLDHMYHEVEKLAYENNRKNDDMQEHIIRLSTQLERRRQSPLRMVEYVQPNPLISQSQIRQQPPQLIRSSISPQRLIPTSHLLIPTQQLLQTLPQQQQILLPPQPQQLYPQQNQFQQLEEQQRQQRMMNQISPQQPQQIRFQQSQPLQAVNRI